VAAAILSDFTFFLGKKAHFYTCNWFWNKT